MIGPRRFHVDFVISANDADGRLIDIKKHVDDFHSEATLAQVMDTLDDLARRLPVTPIETWIEVTEAPAGGDDDEAS